VLRLLCITIVAVFQCYPAAAAPISEDVPVPGGTLALAQALGIDPAPDRGRFIYEISRLLYNTPDGRKASADTYLAVARQAISRGRQNLDTRAGDVIPVPLTTELWGSAVFHRNIQPRDLVNRSIRRTPLSWPCVARRRHAQFLRGSSAARRTHLRAVGTDVRGVISQLARARQPCDSAGRFQAAAG